MANYKVIDESKVIELYTIHKMTLRMVADELGTDHHRVKRILLKHGINITRKGRIRKPFTEEHKKKISESSKGRIPWSKGKKMDKITVLKNMINHIKYDISLEDLKGYEDIEKLKVLNRMLTRDRVSKHFDTEKYLLFLNKFYYNKRFNKIYQHWIDNDKDRWCQPSLDHIIPIAKGGTYNLNNLQILTWFENRSKCDMTQEEWEIFKQKNKTFSDYFI